VAITSLINITSPEALLTQAAKAAEAMLPELEAKRAMLVRELETLAVQIDQVRAIANYGTEPPTPALSIMERAQCQQDIDAVLITAGMPLRVTEIRERIQKDLGRNWAESTIYGHLSKGKASGRYINEANRWFLTTEPPENRGSP